MKTVQHLHQLTFLEHLFPVNCYLVEEERELTLIDAALPYSAKSILSTALTIGKPITRIVLTHGHEDHVGALDQLKKHIPNAKVYISERDSHLLAGDRSLFPNEPNLQIRGGVPKQIKTKADFFIKDKDVIGSLLCVSSPGHTPGLMSFVDTRTNALIAGDAFQTRGGIAVSGHMQWLFPFPALATWNRVAAIDSAIKLMELNPTLLAVGHGKMLKEPIEAMNKAIEKAKKDVQIDKKRAV
ncbi:MBL fold metallo-hydrolase [Halalkalibacter alkalisediminis]|uniref:MBL fold metallo-hydrolase n=1 Tax=Halalkalibacter alkalisediminis TaxID=935616 RepID=A0ABV6NHJ5_9BACI|nr:MBL fold metallo-hydrolase [Halalkalibacter alkalisediminis]